jgi:hypothetical protein
VVAALLSSKGERVGLPGHLYSSGVGLGERVGMVAALLSKGERVPGSY